MNRRSLARASWTGMLLMMVGLAVPHAAGDSGPADFAYGWEIEAPARADYLEFLLPLELYHTAIHGELRDVAVFNAAKEPVPRFIYQPEIVERSSESRIPLSVLPLWQDPTRPAQGLNLKIRRNSSGEIIELDSAPPGETRTDRVLQGYIVDARRLQEIPRTLTLKWQPIEETFLGQVTIEASNDLASWRRVGSGAIAGLLHAEQSLMRRNVGFTPGRAEFYRITWSGLPDGWRLSGVEAVFPASWVEAIERRDLELEPEQPEEQPDPGKLVLEFDAGGYLLVDALEPRLETDNSIVRARFFSRKDGGERWMQRHDAIIYRLRNESGPLYNEPIPLRPIRARYWRVVVTGAPAGESLRLGLTWRPDRLGFVTQGEAPWLLVAGSTQEQLDGYPLHQRFADPALAEFWRSAERPAGSVGTARTGRMITLSGPDATAPPPATLPWRTWLLWTALIVGVLLVGGMALSLRRQLGRC